MPEKQSKNSGVRFKPGVSGNPKGRPKKERCFSDIARQLLASKKIDIEYSFPKEGKLVTSKMHMESSDSMYHSLAAALIREGMAGNVNAIRELIDRTEGKAIQFIEQENPEDTNPIKISFEVIDGRKAAVDPAASEVPQPPA